VRIGYLDCFSGISGDMCLGALVDAGVPLDVIRQALAQLPISGYWLEAEKVLRAGISATRVRVVLADETSQPQRGLGDVLQIVRGARLQAAVEEKVCAVFRCLAEAEARVHGTDADSVHFHEVGAVDAICDVVGTVVGLDWLRPDQVLFGTVSLGGGLVKAAHGSLPVPAPATAELLKGLPTVGGPVNVELTTPTGAAILKVLGCPSSQWPAMQIERLGYGAGARDLEELPNVLRLAVGTTETGAQTDADCVWCLEVNLDDMTGEEVGFCAEKLREAGALDVFTTPIQMKKNRPGVLLSVLCAPGDLAKMESLIWRHSTTLGIRRALWQRSKLTRRTETVQTPWGEVRVKLAFLGQECVRCEPEYEDCRAIAEREGLPLREVYRKAREGCQPRA